MCRMSWAFHEVSPPWFMKTSTFPTILLSSWNLSFHRQTFVVVLSLSHAWDPMNCSMPGFPVLHYLLEFAQTQVHSVNNIIQPSHPLSPPSPPALNLSQHQGLFLFTSSGQSIGAPPSALVLPMNIQDWFPLGWTGWISLLSKTTLKTLLHTDLSVRSKSPCNLCTDFWRYSFAQFPPLQCSCP